jgi:hypothetical protein
VEELSFVLTDLPKVIAFVTGEDLAELHAEGHMSGALWSAPGVIQVFVNVKSEVIRSLFVKLPISFNCSLLEYEVLN